MFWNAAWVRIWSPGLGHQGGDGVQGPAAVAIFFSEIMNETGATVSDLTTAPSNRSTNRSRPTSSNLTTDTWCLPALSLLRRRSAGRRGIRLGPQRSGYRPGQCPRIRLPVLQRGRLGSHWFDVAAEAARFLGKPIYVGETGISLASGCMTAAQRADVRKAEIRLLLGRRCLGVLTGRRLDLPTTPELSATPCTGTMTRCWVERSSTPSARTTYQSVPHLTDEHVCLEILVLLHHSGLGIRGARTDRQR